MPSAVLGSSRIQNAHHGLNQPGSGCAAASYIPVLMLSNRRWKRTLPRPHQRCEAAFKCTTHTRTTWWDRACRGDRSGVGQAAPRCGAQRILIPTNVNHTRSVTRQTNLETVRSLARNPLAWWTILRARGGHPTLLPARQTRSSSSWHEGGIGGCTTTHGATPAARPRFSAKLRRPVGPARPCGARSEWDRRPAGEAHNDEALTWPRVRRAGLPLCRTAALPAGWRCASPPAPNGPCVRALRGARLWRVPAWVPTPWVLRHRYRAGASALSPLGTPFPVWL